MKRILLFVVVVCILAKPLCAQQDPLYSQYINNPFVINPAYTGMTNNLSASVSYRQQWTSFEGNPTTLNANGHISLASNTMGLGLMFVSDKIGATTVNEVYASYAYRIKFTDDKTLSFGLQAGFVNLKIQNSKLLLQDPNDPLFSGETNERNPSIGSGVIFSSDKFFIGLSVPRMLTIKSNVGEEETSLYSQHFYAMASYLFFINDHVSFKPSLLTKVVQDVPASVDINAALVFDQRYTAGLLTRNFSTYGVFLQGVFKDSFRLGYTFEIPTNKSVGTKFSTHEISIGIRASVFRFHQNDVTNF